MKNKTAISNSRKTKSFILSTLIMAAFVLSPPANADVISDWNTTASDYLTQNAATHYDRGMTMVHVAQFDAVNAVLGGYIPYALNVTAPGASSEAAAVQAAYTVLTNISRANISVLNSARTSSLAAIPDGQAKDTGIQLGTLAASQIIQLRAADNPNLSITPPTSTAIGKWRISPPSSPPGVGANSRYALPWTLRSISQFRPGPPPALTSEQYATDFNEARLLGALNSTNRTLDQTAAANFHSGTDQTYLRPALSQRPLPLIGSARFVALFYMASADAINAFYEAQYAYSFWRPITAIRLADNDGNDATASDATWNPLLDTPNHPEYPSGTCAFTAAMVDVVISVFGDEFSFTGIRSGAPTPRMFARPSAAVEDAIVARIATGAHFRTSCLTGVELGRNIARYAMQNYLRPVPNLASGAWLNTGEFQLQLSTGRATPYVIETSSDLAQWAPWQTSSYGTILQTDTNAAAVDRRFYRVRLLTP